jgi:hypothetical protein
VDVALSFSKMVAGPARVEVADDQTVIYLADQRVAVLLARQPLDRSNDPGPNIPREVPAKICSKSVDRRPSASRNLATMATFRRVLSET